MSDNDDVFLQLPQEEQSPWVASDTTATRRGMVRRMMTTGNNQSCSSGVCLWVAIVLTLLVGGCYLCFMLQERQNAVKRRRRRQQQQQRQQCNHNRTGVSATGIPDGGDSTRTPTCGPIISRQIVWDKLMQQGTTRIYMRDEYKQAERARKQHQSYSHGKYNEAFISKPYDTSASSASVLTSTMAVSPSKQDTSATAITATTSRSISGVELLVSLDPRGSRFSHLVFPCDHRLYDVPLNDDTASGGGDNSNKDIPLRQEQQQQQQQQRHCIDSVVRGASKDFCAICLNPYQPGQNITTSSQECGHEFHIACLMFYTLEQWDIRTRYSTCAKSKINVGCPLCRTPYFTEDDLAAVVVVN